MRVEHPVLADFLFQSQFFAVGRQKQLNRRSVVADAVIQGGNPVFGVDPLDGHHAHQDMLIPDLLGVAREQRFHLVGRVGFDDDVHPVARDIDAGERAFFNDFVDLHHHNTLVKSGRFHQGRRVFRTVTRIEVAVAVCLLGGHKADVGGKIDKESGIEFKVGMDGTDFQGIFFEHLGQPHTLDAGVGEVDLACDPPVKNIEVLVSGYRGDQHGDVIDLFRINLG